MNFLWWLLGLFLALIFGPFAGTGATPHMGDAPVAPVYTCDSLSAAQVNSGEFVFTTGATVMHGAVITGYTYDFGDGIVAVTDGRGTKIHHPYAEPGTYTATVKVNVKVAGTVKWVTGPSCRTTVTVIETP